MDYKSILTYFDEDNGSSDRLAAAIGITRQFDAHLTVAAFGYDPNIPAYAFGDASSAALMQMASFAKESADNRKAHVDGVIGAAGILGDVVPVVCTFDALAREFGQYAQFSDLVVLGRSYGKDIDSTVANALEGALFDGDGAVLICPPGWQAVEADRVMIAWNGSRECLKAVRRALPFLYRATVVEITVFGAPKSQSEPGAQLATMLSRHGLGVEVSVHPQPADSIGDALRQRALETGAGLVVMGAYGHSRLREYVIGGATRDMLTDVTVPILMAH